MTGGRSDCITGEGTDCDTDTDPLSGCGAVAGCSASCLGVGGALDDRLELELVVLDDGRRLWDALGVAVRPLLTTSLGLRGAGLAWVGVGAREPKSESSPMVG